MAKHAASTSGAFQLCDVMVCFQLLKVGDDRFSLEFGWPLTGLQAVGLALAGYSTSGKIG